MVRTPVGAMISSGCACRGASCKAASCLGLHWRGQEAGIGEGARRIPGFRIACQSPGPGDVRCSGLCIHDPGQVIGSPRTRPVAGETTAKNGWQGSRTVDYCCRDPGPSMRGLFGVKHFQTDLAGRIRCGSPLKYASPDRMRGKTNKMQGLPRAGNKQRPASCGPLLSVRCRVLR